MRAGVSRLPVLSRSKEQLLGKVEPPAYSSQMTVADFCVPPVEFEWIGLRAAKDVRMVDHPFASLALVYMDFKSGIVGS